MNTGRKRRAAQLLQPQRDRAAKEHLPAVASSPSPSDSGTTVLEPLRVRRRLDFTKECARRFHGGSAVLTNRSGCWLWEPN